MSNILSKATLYDEIDAKIKVVSTCFHCDETIPKNVDIVAEINGQNQAMCCHGCKAVAEFINNEGYCEFYDFRGNFLPNSQANVEDQRWLNFDEENLFNASTTNLLGSIYLVKIHVEGMYCSACGWLLDKHLKNLSGVKDVKLNSITKQLHVEFQEDEIKLSAILSSINHLGYTPLLNDQLGNNDQNMIERKDALKRFVAAGFAMMFIMTLSVPLYSSQYSGIDPQIKRFFSLMSLLIATLVYFYSAKSFLKNAYRDIINKHLGMDVPVALSITLAYGFSVYNVLSRNGADIYFDSMTMFVFFLLAGRYIEMTVRHEGLSANEALGSMIPVTVKLVDKSQLKIIPFDKLEKGDIIEVSPGETIAIDGKIIKGQANINESMITGESYSILRKVDEKVMAGSIVDNGTVQIKASAIGDKTILSSLTHLLEKAQMQKPKTLQVIDLIAGWFVTSVLILATLTALYYWLYDPDKTLVTVLAVLVASCPCALSLATPSALTASSVKLMRNGVLINNLDIITKIKDINYWFFDKTGTLTEPHMSVNKIKNFSKHDDKELLQIMASLEKDSLHPIASAFNDYYNHDIKVIDLIEDSNCGIQAYINNDLWKTGTQVFCDPKSDLKIKSRQSIVFLSKNDKLVAVFDLENPLRKGAKKVIEQLKSEKKYIAILSGDRDFAVNTVAKTLNILNFIGEQSPEQKIKIIKDHQLQSKSTIMIGDGINDAPVLAQSDVSISFHHGTQLARSASDIIIMGNSLTGILNLLAVSKKTSTIIKQNITWAIIYNLSITPLAVLGYLTPWMAAIGMSLSSLFVVLNAKRILLK